MAAKRQNKRDLISSVLKAKFRGREGFRCLTIAEAAKEKEVTQQTIRNAIKRKEIFGFMDAEWGKRTFVFEDTKWYLWEPSGKALKRKKKRKLLYRECKGDTAVVFAPPGRARYISRIWKAINSSDTWGQFQKAMPVGEGSDIIEGIKSHMYVTLRPDGADEDDWPKGNEPFDLAMVPGVTDGMYPPWLQQEMLDFIPDELIQRFCASGDTWHDGDFCNVPMENLDAFCAALTEFGFEVKHAPHLYFY